VGSVKRLLHILAAVLFVSVFSSGCGYHVHSQAVLPFTEVNIGLLKNETVEPKLQDRLHRALTEEFLKQGISISPAAKYTLTGAINRFEMAGLSEKAGITVEYRVIIAGDFKLVDSEGKVAWTRNLGAPFIISFTGTGDLGSLIASREVAEEQAMKDIAIEIVGALIYK
jgi:outer membrane lipopolysaccharide assembly protein LptE/RlpB